ncbi:MAG: dolichyl-phosphate-mannose-protein mannosyltransferase [Candidatus Gottesmanbacteria bacterium GW2011_GWA2_43_14]|uniref:Dolichyl-phosphate-mannose-protein mannosyltransferase n=1 Tax=Candidatus Gottesmanbacteria bacterium GW2011_GWA2_43_14 TaxID=1618443 RepID=A0A0G1GIT5_9BACT|nr:MAG: dolichyl-phosphate-mannose-protein mannosyltransferase [Candidatus Gottesmanbacteria bacterium GW2011_GWA2_43_14]
MPNIFRKSNFPLFILAAVILLAGFLRFYRISEYLTFLGDEGRDVLVVKRMLVDGKLTLLGPITSVGSIYMGPIFYYLMAPFLFLWKFDPTGPAVMVALFSLATVYLVFRIGRDFLDTWVGLAAAFFYAISPLTIIYGRASWNPNVVPFFACLYMYSLMKVLISKNDRWLAVAGLALGMMIQLHYVTFMFFLITAVLFLVFRRLPPIKYLLYFLVAFLAAYSPFILFEIRHGFVNTQGALKFFWQQEAEAGPSRFVKMLTAVNDISVRLFWRLHIIAGAELTKIYLVSLILVTAILFKKKLAKYTNGLKFLLVWLIVGIISYGLYGGVIYDYYMGSLFALPFLFSGMMLYLLYRSGWGKAVSLTILAVLTYFNIINTPIKQEPNNLLKNTRDIADFVYEKSEGNPYNFALIAGKNSDHAYRYFLELWKRQPVVIENPQIDPERKSVTGQLLIVCEEKICMPLGHPLWEIAGFGQAEIEGEWQVSTAKVFKLVPYDG